MTGIPDCNDDTRDDLAYGVPDCDYNGYNDVGLVYVFKGTDNGPAFLQMDIGSSGSRYGFSLASTRKYTLTINGDTLADLVAGGPNWSNGGSTPGAIRVFYGSSSGLSGGTQIYGASNGERFGYSVACVGDTYYYGYYSDVLVGAPEHSNGQTKEGKAYLFRGGSSGINTTAAWTVESGQSYAYLGWSVAGGDVSYDGIADLIIGDPYEDSLGYTDNGKAHIFLGVAYDVPSSSAYTVVGLQSYIRLGWSVAFCDRVFYRTPGMLVGAPDGSGGGTASAWYYTE